MQTAAPSIVWRHLHAGELDHESLWLAVSGAGAAVAAGWLHFGLPVPPCMFHLLTGIPCPTCGVTRMTRHLLHGDVVGALHYNPLALCGVAAIVVFDLYAVLVLLFRFPRVRVNEIPPRVGTAIRITVCSVILLNWAWLIAAGV